MNLASRNFLRSYTLLLNRTTPVTLWLRKYSKYVSGVLAAAQEWASEMAMRERARAEAR